MRHNLIFSAVIWCGLIVNYYIVAFSLKSLPGDIFKNSFTMAFSDVLSYLISGFVLQLCGLKLSVFLSLITAGAGAVLLVFYYHYIVWITLFIILCRVGNSMLLNIVYVTNNRLFPTQFQSSSLGILNFICHVIAVTAPLIAETDLPLPFIIYAVNCGIAMFSSFFLRELNGPPILKSLN